VAANTYIAGQIVEFPAQFLNDQLAAVDPATISFLYSINGGATTTLTYSGSSTPAVNVVARLGTGLYEAQLDTTGYATTGTGVTVPVVYEWKSTGAQTVEPSSMNVQAAPL
jgi:hypothetical protein